MVVRCLFLLALLAGARAVTLPSTPVLPPSFGGSGCGQPITDAAAVAAAWQAVATALRDSAADPAC